MPSDQRGPWCSADPSDRVLWYGAVIEQESSLDGNQCSQQNSGKVFLCVNILTFACICLYVNIYLVENSILVSHFWKILNFDLSEGMEAKPGVTQLWRTATRFPSTIGLSWAVPASLMGLSIAKGTSTSDWFLNGRQIIYIGWSGGLLTSP